ncbi:LA2681 family HEPN domain-containing protein [Bradyrhizobium aeschynomenes]|uniref:LA2681 family HEPN domain-containing protein n=1 Tax=Bradyrhizobium aeschynomenes TaxID=2734909 RepID=UPI001555E3BB|nr:LA2681 family HEPN domain-containing protein [Bradyrhizobium aeschynomenes]NPV20375.1 hypothetical protein [Bradyrhizobium aeschynomenes]
MPQDIQLIFDKLMAGVGIDGRSDEVAMNRIGTLIDVATDLGREDGIAAALAWSDELARRSLSDPDAALIEYFRANAWEARKLQKHRDEVALWDWEQPEAQQQILHLRKAMRHPGFQKLDSVRQCQIQTNLGNQLSHIGRFVESLPRWEGALAIRPRFGMALGNRGYGLKQYGHALYDPGHARVFFATAHAQFSAALAPEAEFEGYDQDQIKARFAELLSEIEEHVDVDAVRSSIKVDGYDLGETPEERAYRRWALDERLFLNPLNDLGPYTIAARDILVLPNYTTAIGEPPTLIGFFNQMKQEFVSARWFLYESMRSDKAHFSDRDVTLYNTLDYPSYGLAVERAKTAYRIAYSLFDKIAYFLNDYAKLGVRLNQVYFRTVWYAGQDARRSVIRDELVKMQNWPLRGLFWLAKDLFDPALQDSAEPEAQELYVIRNCLEHSYLKVHEILPSRSDTRDPFRDRLAHSVQREAFVAKTLLVLRRARAALIYLSLGVHREEKRRSAGKKDGLIAPMHLGHWDDDWKR